MSSQILPQYMNYTKPAVVITFDDGRASLYTEAFAYMNALGIKGTGYIISGSVNSANYVTTAQVVEMDAAGWDMANHTDTITELSTLSEADQETALLNCKNFLDGIGATRAAHHVAYPSGKWNADTLTAMAAQSMLTGRVYPAASRENFRYFVNSPYLLPVYSIDTSVSVLAATDYMDACLCDGAIPFILFHDIFASGASGVNYNRADFRAIIDHIASKHFVCLTISQLYSLFSGSLEYTNYW